MDNHTTKKRAALYVRVSTEEQRDHGLSIDNQLAELKDYCKDNSYSVAGIYNDAGISGRKPYTKRPELLRMLCDCQNGKIDIVLFTKLDRWFRSVKDYYACVDRMNGVPWRAIWEDYETETSAGVFKVNIMLSVAQAEADRTSERIKKVMDYKKAMGQHVGGIPVGYYRENGYLHKDKEKEPAVTAFFDAALLYKPLSECIKAAAENGLTLDQRQAYGILHSAVYRSENGFLSADQARIIDKRNKSRIVRRHSIPRLFNGLVFCGGCGHMMTAAERTINNKRIAFYSCRKEWKNFRCETGCYILEKKLEDMILEKLEPALNECNSKIESSTADPVEVFEKKHKAINGKMRRLADLYEDGLIEREEYKEKLADLKHQLETLTLADAPKKVELPPEWRAIYDSLNAESRAEFWHKIIKKIIVEPAKERAKNREIKIFFY